MKTLIHHQGTSTQSLAGFLREIRRPESIRQRGHFLSGVVTRSSSIDLLDEKGHFLVPGEEGEGMMKESGYFLSEMVMSEPAKARLEKKRRTSWRQR